MNRRFLFPAVLALALAFVVGWWLLRPREPRPLPDAATPPSASVAVVPSVPAVSPPPVEVSEVATRVPPGQPALIPYVPRVPPAAKDRSPMADHLNEAAGTPDRDLAIVQRLFDRFRESFGVFPTGEDNRQIVNALSGNNPRHLIILPRDCPAIDAAGRLTDRWRSPLFFHSLARDAVEIRSAGPDRIMWTADDVQRSSRPRDTGEKGL